MNPPKAAHSLARAPVDAVPYTARLRPEPGDTFTADIPMRWGDMDALAHLNNAAYFRLMEEARVQMMHGSSVAYPPDTGIVLAHVSCDFLRPITYPATVRVVHTVTRIGRTSAELDLTLSVAGDTLAKPCARARTVLVWMDLASGTSAPWPADILAGLAAQMSPA